MKKLRENIDRFFDRLDERWRAMPLRTQHLYTLYLFTGYLLLTVIVIVTVWYDARQSKNDMQIDHIENPVIQKSERPASLQDTLTTIFKNRFYERK